MSLTRRQILAVTLALPASLAATRLLAAEPPVYAVEGIALGGTDPVAYFIEGKPVEGRMDYTLDWNGATWVFSSKENMDLFTSAPEKYAPQFGGYCAYAVSRNYTAPTDPSAWTIHEGKLYLNYSRPVRALWNIKRADNIAKGHANWPDVLNR